MTKDLFFSYPCQPIQVYSAYLQTANEQFSKQCREDVKGAVFSFGLDYSFKYNMNGGSCTVRFMPYQGGTAVAIHYTVVQLFGAKIGKHSTDMVTYADKLLGVKSLPTQLNLKMFTDYAASLSGQGGQPAVVDPQGLGAPLCPNCGGSLTPGAKFCVSCGKPVPAAPAVCPNCGRAFQENENFCVGCGTKRPD